MTDPKLIVRDPNGNLLFDTRKITYGLVKSGYMTLLQYWTRRVFKGGNIDPTVGANWTESRVVYAPARDTDALHGFTVLNARSPIAFITGGGSLNAITRNPDGSATFFYTGASDTSKFFCFDLMSNDIVGKPSLKTFKADGTLTFNSLQPALNVITTYEAPPPRTAPGISYVAEPYTGGYGVWARLPQVGMGTYRYYINIPLGGGVEYAANLPWSRGAQCRAFQAPSTTQFHGVVEGCFGGNGSITFCFCEAAGTPNEIGWNGMSATTYSGLAVTPRPVAMVISTSNLPFPFR